MPKSIAILLSLSLFVSTSTTWRLNENAMDLAIGVDYFRWPNDKDAALLISVMKKLVEKLNISPNTGRVALVEYGSTDNVLLNFDDDDDGSSNSAKVIEAIQKIEVPTITNFSSKTAAESTRRLVDRSDRIAAPKLALLFKFVDASFLNGSKNWSEFRKEVKVSTLVKFFVHAVFLSKFDDADSKFHFGQLYRFVYEKNSTKIKFTNYRSLAKIDASTAADTIAKAIRKNLATCAFVESTSRCFDEGEKSDCVKNISYELAYSANSSTFDARNWKRVRHYCLANGSKIECTSDECRALGQKCEQSGMWSQCNATCGSTGVRIRNPTSAECRIKIESCLAENCSTTEPVDVDEQEFYYDDDPLVVNLKRAIIGLSIGLILVIIFDVLVVCHGLRLRRRKKMKGSGDASNESLPTDSISSRKAEWSVGKPPSLTITSTDTLLHEYSAKPKKDKKSKAAISKNQTKSATEQKSISQRMKK